MDNTDRFDGQFEYEDQTTSTDLLKGKDDDDVQSPKWKVKTRHLLEKVVPSQGIQTLSSIFSELKERYDAAFWTVFVVTIIANVLILIFFVMFFIIYIIGHFDYVSWGVPSYLIPILKLQLLVTVLLNVFLHIFSLLFLLTFNKSAMKPLKSAAVFLYSVTIITVVCLFLAKLAFIIINWGFLVKDCLVIIGLFPCVPKMTNTIWIYNVISLFELLIVFGFGVFLIVYGFYRDFSVYKISAKTRDILSKRTRELRTKIMENRLNKDTDVMNDFRNLIVKTKLDVHLQNGAAVRKDLELNKIKVGNNLLNPNVKGMFDLKDEVYKK